MDATPSMSLLDRHVRAEHEQVRDFNRMELDSQPDCEEGMGSGEESVTSSKEGGRFSRVASGDGELCILGESWPMSISMRQTLQGSDDNMDAQIAALFGRSSIQISNWGSASFENQQSRRLIILDPDAWPMMLVDIVSSLILLHDLFVTPYVVVMDLNLVGLLRVFAIVAACFWTIDFLVGFQTGFYVRGELNTKHKAIVSNYLKTWCIPNLLFLAFDWMSMFGGSGTQALKVVRLVKVFRLARLIRLVDKLSTWCSLSPFSRTALQVSKIVFGVLIYNHFVSCLWLFIGRRVQSDTGEGWLDYLVEGEPLSEQSFKYQYVTSFHWTLAQMTPGPIDIVASNTVEQVVNSILLILGLLFGSLIVSLCSGQVMQLIMAQRDITLKLEALERFLRQSAIGSTLVVKVKRQVFDRMSQERHITENDVSALRLLSATLRTQVICETRRPHLVSHALFRTWQNFDVNTFNLLCEKAVSLQFLSSEDDLFLPEEEATGAWCMIKGTLLYSQWPESAKVKDFSSKHINGTAWLCEAGLWSHWIHVGRMEAVSACQLLFIDADGLMAVCCKKLVVALMIKQYGRNFHLRIISSSPPFAEWPDDLQVPYTEMVDLVSKDVGMGLLKKALRSGTLRLEDEKRRALEDEVRNEKCALQELPSGELQRIVAVVTLRLHRAADSEEFLTVLGKWAPSGGAIVATCELPGAKRGVGELPQKALQRVLDRHLYPFAGFAQLTDITHETFTRDSPKFGLCTQYLKTTHEGYLSPGGQAVELPGIKSKDQPDVPILPRDVYMVKEGTEVVLYAWVNSQEFAYLNENQQKLAHWLGGLEDGLRAWDRENKGAPDPRTLLAVDASYMEV